MPDDRRYERIEIELPCRLFVPDERGLRFEAFTTTLNLGLGGVFVRSSFVLREGLELWVELTLPEARLPVRARVTHAVPAGDADVASGMGIEFLDVDAAGRETLLRYFAPERYRRFFAGFTLEFPHLDSKLRLPDVALVLNLWEEWKVRQEGGPRATASGAPEGPRRRPGGRRAGSPGAG
jgi:Tfp pilus assembly protein PilZ